MSQVDRLLIQGIRSFEPGKAEVIRIFSPLTLIVGSNGSGKTTIIECLRYATTGELPPNSHHGGAWIHDPKLVGESEILARVKLSFFTAGGEYMVVDRKIQLSVKKTTRTQKTLEGSILVKNPKTLEETRISSRVADLDSLMPQYLGVSKAILESVIFCHQDESLWPMSTPTMLKKKFDEIFEAEKYTKAIDNIKSIRKKQQEELTKLKIIHSHAKEDKEKGARAQRKSEELFQEIESLREQHEALTSQINAANEQSTAAWDMAATFRDQLAALNEKHVRVETLEDSLASISVNLKVMNETDEELQRMQDEHEDDVSKIEKEKQKLTKQYDETEDQIKSVRYKLGEKQTDVGMFKQAMNQYDKHLEERAALVQETARQHNIRGFDGEVTQTLVQDFMDRLNRLAQEGQALCDSVKHETQSEATKLQKTLNTLNEKRSILSQSRDSTRKQIESNDSRIDTLQRQLNLLDVNEGNKAVFETQLLELETRLQSAKSDFRVAEYSTKIETLEEEVEGLSKKKDRLDDEQADAMRRAANMGQMEYLIKELKNRQMWLDTNIKSYQEEFRKALSSDWTPDTLDDRFKTAMTQRVNALQSAEIKRDRIQLEKEKHQFKLAETTRQLEDKRRHVTEAAATIRKAIDEEPSKLPERVKDLEDALDVLKHDNTSFANMKEYYERCLDSLQKQHKCQLCQRGISGDEERRFMTRLRGFLDEAVAKIEMEDQGLLEKEYENAKNAKSSYEVWLQLQESIPDLEKVIRELEQHLDGFSRQLESADEEVNDKMGSKRELEALSKPVQNIVKCCADIANYREQIQDFETKQDSTGVLRPSSIIQDEIKNISNEIRRLNLELSQVRSNRERQQQQVRNLELEFRDAQVKLSDATHQLREKTGLDVQIADLRSLNQAHRDLLKNAEIEVNGLQPQIVQCEEKLEDVLRTGNDRERELLSQLATVKGSIGRLELTSHQINEFISNGGPQSLARGTREMEQIEKDLKQLESDLARIGRECNRVAEDLRNHDGKKQQIINNLTFRQGKRQLVELKTEIANVETSNAEADKKKFEREGQKWQNRRNELSAEQASIAGQIKSKDDQLESLLNEWESDYKDAAFKFKEAQVKLAVTQAAVEDLSRYAGALDKAIMKYHSMKMERINKIIDELWRKTYRGSDVDTVMIKSENETQRGNKSYNYRVVMIKGGAEMDMRGRCSAGQKVLASIIIRLALAECFSVNCGLIALDEPTTNLDRSNIMSLAVSLNELIKVRRAQKNFQLIVITHDEDFLRHMNCAELCDEYFRVFRDVNQKSEIKRQMISEVYR